MNSDRGLYIFIWSWRNCFRCLTIIDPCKFIVLASYPNISEKCSLRSSIKLQCWRRQCSWWQNDAVGTLLVIYSLFSGIPHCHCCYSLALFVPLKNWKGAGWWPSFPPRIWFLLYIQFRKVKVEDGHEHDLKERTDSACWPFFFFGMHVV